MAEDLLQALKLRSEFLYQFVVKQRDFSEEVRRVVLREWEMRGLSWPEWIIPYYTEMDTKTCLRLNDRNGVGCHVYDCNMRHVCIVCGNPYHGAFQMRLRVDTGMRTWTCLFVRHLDEELTKHTQLTTDDLLSLAHELRAKMEQRS